MKKQLQAVIAAMLVAGSLSLHAQTATTAPATTNKTAKAGQLAAAPLSQHVKTGATDATMSSSTTLAENTEKAGVLTAVPSSLHAEPSSAAQATSNELTVADLNNKIDSPSAIHYKGVNITPVAFFAAEGVWRQRAVNSDINTPFNTIPMPGANEGHVSELNFSGRQSRLGVLVEAPESTFKLTGYAEMDFLSSGVTSNNNQSNSYTLRQRQIWGKIETSSGFAMSGGQMWSLVTEDGKGTDNRTEKLPNTIDAQYMVGFSWERQPSFRFQQRWGDYKTGAFTLAASLEQAQITNFTATSATSGAVPTNFFFAGGGQGGGLYNAFNGTYANNVAPDIIVKGAWDFPNVHFELGGLARFLRDTYYPITNTTGSYTYSPNPINSTKTAGGVFGTVRVSPSKFVDLAVQAMAGDGVGRYGSAQLADATLHPDGTLEPIRNYHGLLTIETHPTPKLDVFAYYGGEYDQRTVYTVTNTAAPGALMGYGAPNLADGNCYALPTNPGSSTGGSPSSPSSCNSPTRYIQEPMIGFIYRVVSSPKYGRLQYWVTYNVFQRNLWSGVGSATTPSGPRAVDPAVFVSMRYYIP